VEAYPAGRGSITFMTYRLRREAQPGAIRPVESVQIIMTNVESVATRLAGAQQLPPQGAFSQHIREALGLP
jgi:hypothetical protein